MSKDIYYYNLNTQRCQGFVKMDNFRQNQHISGRKWSSTFEQPYKNSYLLIQ